MLEGLGPLVAIECLMRSEVVVRRELYSTRCAYQLVKGWRWCSRRRWTADRVFSCLAIVLFVGDEVLVTTKDYVTLLASENVNNG